MNDDDPASSVSTAGSRCLGEFDLTDIQPSNAFCWLCGNLSLSQHGPWPSNSGRYGCFHPSVEIKNIYRDKEGHALEIAIRGSADTDVLYDLFEARRCQFCNMIWMALVTFGAAPIRLEDKEILLLYINLREGRNIQISAKHEGQDRSTPIELYCTDNQIYPFEELGEPTHDLQPYCDNDSLDFIASCLNDCRQHHTICAELTGEQLDSAFVRPSRLIYVGESEKEVRLVVTDSLDGRDGRDGLDGLDGRISYVALSHCWGPTRPAKTLYHNFSRFKQNIPTDSISQVFKDAIFLTRRYGFKYIWIDSLCIIQDDLKDWAYESSRMYEVYRYANLVICANRSHDGEVPFLGPSAPYIRDYARFRLNALEGGIVTVKARELETLFSNSKHCDGPLSRRAWAFQEVLSSSRCIQFSEKTTRWICEHGAKCIDKPNPVPCFDSLYGDHVSIQSWFYHLSQYSSCALSIPTDKLPALAGLATWYGTKLAEKQPGMTYFAGHWSPGLVESLSWRIEGHRIAIQHDEPIPSEYIAPSWSWASIPYAVIWYDSSSCIANTKLVSWSCVPKTENLYAEVQPFSYVVLRGKSIGVWLEYDQTYFPIGWLRSAEHSNLEQSFYVDSLPFMYRDSHESEDVILRRARSQEEAQASSIFRAPAICHLLWKTDICMMALILGKTGREPGELERIGFVKLITSKWVRLFDDVQDTDVRIV